MVFIEPTQIEIANERAEVFVTVLDETTSQRQPIHYVWFRVFLARTGSSWQTKVQVLGET
jgi:hypothetical protein